MRSLGIVLAVALAFTVVGCSDDDSSQNMNNNNHQYYQDSSVQQDTSVQQDSSQPLPDSSQPRPDANIQPGDGITGDSCGSPGQCGGITNGTPECLSTLMSIINFPGGYCSSQSCTENTPCDNGTGTCVSLMGFAKACLQACTAATECRQSEGYDCTTIPYVGGTETYCLPGGGVGLPDGGFGMGDGGFGLGDGGLPF